MAQYNYRNAQNQYRNLQLLDKGPTAPSNQRALAEFVPMK
jgi:hypothetical protein